MAHYCLCRLVGNLSKRSLLVIGYYECPIVVSNLVGNMSEKLSSIIGYQLSNINYVKLLLIIVL